MCCFSRPVKHVAATRIFARRLGDGMQALVYSMSLSFDSELAMVLPLPVARGSGESAVRFIDLSGYPKFFDDLEKAFPPLGLLPAKGPSRAFGALSEQVKLVVHDVGDFEASFVPTRKDFDRLDPRFRLDSSVWDSLPDYADFGFAVFRLKPHKSLFGGLKTQTVHPMAFAFPSREPDSVFFPTVHIHDGTVPATARFDHTLYLQDDGVIDATLGWSRSTEALGVFVDAARASAVVDSTRDGLGTGFMGDLPNVDIWLRSPPGLDRASLSGRGECFRYHLRARCAYHFGPVYHDRIGAWAKSALRIAHVARAIGPILRELEATERGGLRLTPLTPDLRPHFINGTQLWTGTDYMNGRSGHDGGSGFVTFQPFTDRLEQQEVVLGFAALPDEATTNRIHELLRSVLDRALDAA